MLLVFASRKPIGYSGKSKNKDQQSISTFGILSSSSPTIMSSSLTKTTKEGSKSA